MTDITKRVSGLVPKVYEDIVRPSAKQVGKSLEMTVKTALRPLNGIVWTLDQAMDYLEQSVTARLKHRKVSRAKIISPSPEITSRVLLGLQVTGPLNDPLPRNLFASLMSNSMVAGNVRETHPAFAEVLRQLVTDECRIVSALSGRPMFLSSVTSYDENHIKKYSKPSIPSFERDDDLWREKLFLDHPANYEFYLDNLKRIGIVTTKWLKDVAQDPGISPEVDSHLGRHRREFEKFRLKHQKHRNCPKELKQQVTILELTWWGQHFGLACDAGSYYDEEKGFITPNWLSPNKAMQPTGFAGG